MSKRVKRPKISFNDDKEFKYLDTTGHVWTLREENFEDKQHVATHHGQKKFVVYVRFIKEVKICLLNSRATHPRLMCENHPQDLQPYYEESWFSTVDEWLETLENFGCDIPNCITNNYKTFYLSYVYKPSKHPLSKAYLKWIKRKES